MLNTFAGNLGHIFVVVAFVSSILATIGYLLATKAATNPLKTVSQTEIQWRKFARINFFTHSFSVFGVAITLFYIIYHHLYEYHYAYDHSSNDLPVQYMISCFWEGQEGSFLLWIVWNVLLGMILMRTQKTWENPVMAVFSVVQVFLTSMILGVVFFGSLKIGSSPFVLTREVLEIPVYNPNFKDLYNPNFIPADGAGLEVLLQNYWMVIHPPTLFLGFALSLVPFAFAVAGLWQKKFIEWLKPAMPWTIISVAVLGVGILMGAYWAYETLNFEGYWNWDPVENAVYVPWLILVASLHTMVAAKKNFLSLKSSFVLVVISFVLVLYSTFLTRSGVLGSASVHSFTDLGLSGQLLVYLLFFLVGAIALMVVRWKDIPKDEKELNFYNREFWIFVGVCILCLSGFQVLNTTSFPVYTKILNGLGFDTKFTLPADQVEHYTKFQLWFAVLITLFSGIGQFFWWRKIDSTKKFTSFLAIPVMVTLLLASVWLIVSQEKSFSYIVLITTALFSIVSNGTVVVFILRKNPKLSGGAVAHIGVAVMLLGILYSSGYTKVLSTNTSALLYIKGEESDDEKTKKLTQDANEKSTLLWLGEPAQMNKYQATYKGMFGQINGFPDYVRRTDLLHNPDNPYEAVVIKDLIVDGKKYFKKGDTVQTRPELYYFKVEFRDKEGKIFHIYPKGQLSNLGGSGVAYSPDIQHYFGKDMYSHIYFNPELPKGKTWSEVKNYTVSPKDTFIVNDFISIFDGVEPIREVKTLKLKEGQMGVKAKIRILGKQNAVQLVEPVFLVDSKSGMVAQTSEEIPEFGLKFTFKGINPQTGEFSFGVQEGQKDFILLKTIEKPLINFLWIGAFIMTGGFLMAIFRRFKTQKSL